MLSLHADLSKQISTIKDTNAEHIKHVFWKFYVEELRLFYTNKIPIYITLKQQQIKTLHVYTHTSCHINN